MIDGVAIAMRDPVHFIYSFLAFANIGPIDVRFFLRGDEINLGKDVCK